MYIIIYTVTVFIFLSNLTYFFSFSCLSSVVRASNAMLNTTGRSGKSCLVDDLIGNAFSFSPSNMMLTVGLSYVAFIMLRCGSSVPTLLTVLSC